MVCESEGELGSGEMRGAALAGDKELTGELPVGEVGEIPLSPPGLFAPELLPLPRKRPLL